MPRLAVCKMSRKKKINLKIKDIATLTMENFVGKSFGGKIFGQVFWTENFVWTNISQAICKYHAKVKLNMVDIENEVNFEVEGEGDFLIDDTDEIILID